jgi:hypothetical protein
MVGVYHKLRMVDAYRPHVQFTVDTYHPHAEFVVGTYHAAENSTVGVYRKLQMVDAYHPHMGFTVDTNHAAGSSAWLVNCEWLKPTITMWNSW